MNRRQFLKTSVVPVLAGCATAQEFGDVSKFFQVRRVGIVMPSTVVAATISQDWPLASRAGADSVYARRIQASFPSHLNQFEPTVRKQMTQSFLTHGISTIDIAYRAEAGRFSPAYGAAESFYLQCATWFIFDLVDGKVEIGARNNMTLLAPGGRTLATARTGRHMPPNKRVSEPFGTSEIRFSGVDHVIRSPELVATELLKLAGPLGAESVEAFLDELRSIEVGANTSRVPTR